MFAVILYKYCVNINSVFWQQKLPSMGYRPNSMTNNIVDNLMQGLFFNSYSKLLYITLLY